MPLRSSSFLSLSLSLSLACGAAGQKHRKEGREEEEEKPSRPPRSLSSRSFHPRPKLRYSIPCMLEARTNGGKKRPGLCVARSLAAPSRRKACIGPEGVLPSLPTSSGCMHARCSVCGKLACKGSLILTSSCRLISLICTAPQIWLTRLELTTSSLELISSCFPAVKRGSFARKWRRREILSCCGQQKETRDRVHDKCSI